MTFKKFQFSEVSKSLYSSPALLNELSYPANSRLKIELIGVPNIDDPSRLTVFIKQEGVARAIPLRDHRSKFIYQNNIFILDTKNLPGFEVDLSTDFSISVSCDSKKEFDLIIYSVADKSAAVVAVDRVEV